MGYGTGKHSVNVEVFGTMGHFYVISPHFAQRCRLLMVVLQVSPTDSLCSTHIQFTVVSPITIVGGDNNSGFPKTAATHYGITTPPPLTIYRINNKAAIALQ